MAKPLDARLAAAMGHGARAATVRDLIAEFDTLIENARAEYQRLDAHSKSVATPESEADEAADEAAKLSRKLVRLEAKQAQLRERHDELMNSERRKRLVAEHEEVKARRDQLVTDIKERWPALTGEIVALLKRIEASDTECAKVNRDSGLERLFSAEAIARECSPIFAASVHGQVTRLASMQIPSLTGSGFQAFIWPDLTQRPIAPIP